MTILIDLQSLLTFGLFASVSCFDDDFVRYSTLMIMMMTMAGRRPHLRSLCLCSLVCLWWICHRGRSNQDQVMMVMMMIVTMMMMVMIVMMMVMMVMMIRF